MKKFQQGFTLIEILIVVAIIILLSVAALLNIMGQMAHATDIKRKADLYTLSKSFEDYFNDHSAFPDQSVVANCGGAFAPYITTIPCDPVSKDHYGYFPSVNGGYRICAKLTDKTDPAIAAAGCSGPAGCGLGGPTLGGVYNYCLASGVTASAVGTVDEISGGGGGGPTSTPTPTPTPTIGPANLYACTPYEDPVTHKGICNYYAHPFDPPPLGGGCPPGEAWPTGCPPGACDIPANRCAF
jgi:prepilin-type N-terminal cleavage/methylation domain-containing protein